MAFGKAVAVLVCLISLTATASAFRADLGSTIPAGDVQDGPACETCLWLVNAVELYVEQPAHQQQLIELLLNDVCPALAPPLRDQCTMMVPVLVPSMVIWVQENMSPSIVCTDVGACASSAWTNISNILGNGKDGENGFECPMCKVLMLQLLQQAQDPANQEAFLDRLIQGCDAMAVDYRADCHKAATDLGQDVIRLVQDVNVDGACVAVKACPATPPLAHAMALLPPSLLALRPKLQALRGAPWTDDNCDTCKVVVLEVAAVLANNETQQEIMVYLKEACGAFDTFKDQCITYVDLYAPLAFNILIQYLQPLPLCTQLGYCPTTLIARLSKFVSSFAQPAVALNSLY